MSKKLDKLNEVNLQLDEIIKRIETHIFLQNIVFGHKKSVAVNQTETSSQIK
jgi:hypothetical protein